MKKPKPKPDKIDIYVGRRVKEARACIGMSQEKLAEAVGVTFQQIQKYERGANRISTSRIAQISKAVDKPLPWFFPPEYREPGQNFGDRIAAQNKVLTDRMSRISRLAGLPCL